MGSKENRKNIKRKISLETNKKFNQRYTLSKCKLSVSLPHEVNNRKTILIRNMASRSLLSPDFTKLACARTSGKFVSSYHQPYFPSTNSMAITSKRREFPLPSVASIPYQPVNVDYLEQEFSGHGVTFEDLGDYCVAKMELANGSTATLMLPSGLITSYKAPMWHGGSLELLHTSVSEGDDGEVVVQGGVSVALTCGMDDQVSWSPDNWVLGNIRGNSEDSIQVELISSDTEKTVETKHIVTLKEDVLSSQLAVTNLKSSPLQWTGSIISHLTVSSPEATYAVGLQGSDIHNIAPFSTKYEIIPPDETGSGFRQTWGSLEGLFTSGGAKSRRQEVSDVEEDDDYKQLSDEMSIIYTSAPSDFTVIDRGRRNSVTIGREGFDELYMFSPGSAHDIYGKYSYICVGQSAVLKPVILGPGEAWQGRQHLQNPNL